MNGKRPLMLTSEPWSDMEARSTRQKSHERAKQSDTIENTQHQRHNAAMQELRDQGGVSRKPYYWAQGGSRDMFTQAVARNVIAISKEKHSPLTKQGPGPLLTPNETVGRQMLAHREHQLDHYSRVVQRTSREMETYGGYAQQAEKRLSALNERRKTADASEHKEIDEDRTFETEHIQNMRSKVSELSLEHDLHRDRLEATQRTEVSWPGHQDWGAITKSMKGAPSKLLTLGHGAPRKNYVSEEIAPTQQSQLHTFDTIVQSQIDSGLPLDNTAKRLDACHATAQPLNPSYVPQLRQLEPLPVTDRNAFLAGSSSAQQMAQAYKDRGVGHPEVKGANTKMARFPKDRPNPTYHNEIETSSGNGRARRRDHSVVQAPTFLKPPSK